jgi:hypothetical protein
MFLIKSESPLKPFTNLCTRRREMPCLIATSSCVRHCMFTSSTIFCTLWLESWLFFSRFFLRWNRSVSKLFTVSGMIFSTLCLSYLRLRFGTLKPLPWGWRTCEFYSCSCIYYAAFFNLNLTCVATFAYFHTYDSEGLYFLIVNSPSIPL